MTIVRDRVTVTGPDARSFLHSQLSNDIAGLAVGDERWAFALEPAGRVTALAEVRAVDDETFTLTTDPGYGDALAARLNRFRIRVKADIEVSSVELDGDADAAESARVARGWPAMGSEIVPGETIPAETGITAIAVSFTKGCYPGQELVERMDSRGANAPRQLRILTVDDEAAVGDAIVDPETGETVGSLTSVAGGKALGYVRRGSDVGEPPAAATTA